ncbi:AAA family ATPase [bacterium]|nr:AAA family ATPase [bacterium]MBU1957155.1 AAA family ATPase [bacterium]
MKIAEVTIKGFRNFKDAKFNFNNHTAIMGFNDIGKTNLIYALRLLLDKNISEADMELNDSDFFVHEETSEIEIVIKFDEVVEDFVLSKVGSSVSDDGIIFLKYTFLKYDRDFKLLMGSSIDLLEEIQGRFYLKAFNLKYVGSSRNLSSFIKKEKKHLLEKAKEIREEADILSDSRIIQNVEGSLSTLNNQVRDISYVKNSTTQINTELNKLSYKNENQELVFDMAGDNIDTLLQKVDLSVLINDKLLAVGGDGKLNQIFLALWTSKYNNDTDLNEVSFYCIEEPEAHLHPHQQRKLSEYLADTLDNQVIITTHSPQIISEFRPNSIIKLFEKEGATYGVNNGCSSNIEDELFNFAHRLDIISTEAFYSNVVFLVEGQSEILFYKALAKAIDIDLDRLNISILMVDGIGFKPYIRVLNLLQIPWVMRTDNDIFETAKNSTLFRYAGITRSLGIYEKFKQKVEYSEDIKNDIKNISGFTKPIAGAIKESASNLIRFVEPFDIFLSQNDLEQDLVNSPLFPKLQEFFNPKMTLEELNVATSEQLIEVPNIGEDKAKSIVDFQNTKPFESFEELCTIDGIGNAIKESIEHGKEYNQEEIIEKMQQKKGSLIFEFLYKYQDYLSILDTEQISQPLRRCKEIIEAQI